MLELQRRDRGRALREVRDAGTVTSEQIAFALFAALVMFVAGYITATLQFGQYVEPQQTRFGTVFAGSFNLKSHTFAVLCTEGEVLSHVHHVVPDVGKAFSIPHDGAYVFCWRTRAGWVGIVVAT